MRQPRQHQIPAKAVVTLILELDPPRRLCFQRPSFALMGFIRHLRMFLFRKNTGIRLMELLPRSSRLRHLRETVADHLLAAVPVPIRMQLDRLRLVLLIVMVQLLEGILCMAPDSKMSWHRPRREDTVEYRSHRQFRRMPYFNLVLRRRHSSNSQHILSSQNFSSNSQQLRSCRQLPISNSHNSSQHTRIRNKRTSLPISNSQ